MGLLGEELHAAQNVAARRGKVCGVARVIEALDPGDAADLLAALAKDSGVGHATIARVLNERGFKIKGGTVGYHRNGECSCEPR